MSHTAFLGFNFTPKYRRSSLLFLRLAVYRCDVTYRDDREAEGQSIEIVAKAMDEEKWEIDGHPLDRITFTLRADTLSSNGKKVVVCKTIDDFNVMISSDFQVGLFKYSYAGPRMILAFKSVDERHGEAPITAEDLKKLHNEQRRLEYLGRLSVKDTPFGLYSGEW